QRYGFSFAELKKNALEQAAATTTNEEFYELMFKFVSEFRDAHTSAQLLSADLPGRTKVAYIGFKGVRDGDALQVTELLPSTSQDQRFPIQLKDKITKLDGKAVTEIVKESISKYRNLGSDEANLTYHLNGIFNRSSLLNGIPESDSATLTVV